MSHYDVPNLAFATNPFTHLKTQSSGGFTTSHTFPLHFEVSCKNPNYQSPWTHKLLSKSNETTPLMCDVCHVIMSDYSLKVRVFAWQFLLGSKHASFPAVCH